MADRIVLLALDPENKKITGKILDSTGAEVSAWGSIELVLGKDPGTTPASPGTTMGKTIKFRETQGCDPETGAAKYCIMPRSEWYDTPLTSDPTT